MFWTVVRVEWRNLRAERAAWTLLALLAAFVAYAAWSGAASVEAERALTRGAVDAEAAELAELRATLEAVEAGGPAPPFARDPADPVVVGQGLLGRVVTLPPAPLAPVARGGAVDASALRLTTQSRLTAGTPGGVALSGPTRQRTGAFDLAFVFVYLLPLLIIALTYDLLAGERERGTLALVLAQPVSLTTFVLGKSFQRAAVVVGVTVVLASVALAAAADDLTSGEGLLRAGLYLAALVAYAVFWFAAAVAVNARARSSSAGNALALVGLWLALVVAVPGLVRVAVEAIHPPPSRVELANLVRSVSGEIAEELDELTGKHGDAAERPDLKLLEVQQRLDARVQPVVASFREQLERQQSLVNRLRFLSPAIVLQEALVDVAGTGALRRQAFDAQVDTFHRQWRAWFFDKARAGERLTLVDYDALPTFEYVEEPLATLSARVGVGLFGLALPAFLLVLWSAPRLRRVGRLA